MFRSLIKAKLPEDHFFSISIGPSTKKTLAKYHLLGSEKLIAMIAALNGDLPVEKTDLDEYQA